MLLLRLAFCVAVGIVAWNMLYHPKAAGSTRTLYGARGHYTLEVVSTAAAQEQGLGGRASLGDHAGMLFKFGTVGDRCFWMKDMRFPLDIVWVDGWHKITRVQPNLSPKTYPAVYCAQARDVIELAAGTAAANGWQVGQTLDF